MSSVSRTKETATWAVCVMESLFDVVVCEPVTLDTESDRSVFVSWVRGLSMREVVLQRLGDFEEEVSGRLSPHQILHTSS